MKRLGKIKERALERERVGKNKFPKRGPDQEGKDAMYVFKRPDFPEANSLWDEIQSWKTAEQKSRSAARSGHHGKQPEIDVQPSGPASRSHGKKKAQTSQGESSSESQPRRLRRFEGLDAESSDPDAGSLRRSARLESHSAAISDAGPSNSMQISLQNVPRFAIGDSSASDTRIVRRSPRFAISYQHSKLEDPIQISTENWSPAAVDSEGEVSPVTQLSLTYDQGGNAAVLRDIDEEYFGPEEHVASSLFHAPNIFAFAIIIMFIPLLFTFLLFSYKKVSFNHELHVEFLT